jgi:hypothetical protein
MLLEVVLVASMDILLSAEVKVRLSPPFFFFFFFSRLTKRSYLLCFAYRSLVSLSLPRACGLPFCALLSVPHATLRLRLRGHLSITDLSMPTPHELNWI